MHYTISVPKVGTFSSPISTTPRNCFVTVQPGILGIPNFGVDVWSFATTCFVRLCYFALRQRKKKFCFQHSKSNVWCPLPRSFQRSRPSYWPCVMFRNMICNGQELLAPRPTPTLEDHPLWTCLATTV